MGSRLHIARVVARLAASYLAILVVLLVGIDIAAYLYLARMEHDLLEPLLSQPEGRAVYAAAMRGFALRLALADVPLLVLAGAAAYALAALSVRPLIEAGEREARFAAEAAHELRTPLARIAALAQRDGVKEITAIAIDAARTIDDLLTLVRAERVAERLAEPVDTGVLLRSVAETFPNDTIRYEIESEDDCWVVGDERRLRRLLENLLHNAVRHARSFVKLSARAERDRVVLAVEDDGAGVPEALRDRIFERFVRGDDDEHGSGLGLAICRSIARAHGGEIALEGRSRFVARLPRIDVKNY
ncbi:MAG TPA: HAMP domain-containing sensor histidine kinase [Candidatus Acidoferrum sp.]|nr:HAMP domain-containing sensor histidine kinase [Candidatus Acidoferrum sp.]